MTSRSSSAKCFLKKGKRASGVMSSTWKSATAPDAAIAAPMLLSMSAFGRIPLKSGILFPEIAPAIIPSAPYSACVQDFAASGSANRNSISGSLFFTMCRPYSGVFPVNADARADGPPSRLVRAPRTEFAYTTAEDSDHARWSPRSIKVK